MEATTMATTTTTIQTTSATVAAPLELTVSGASVNATEVKKNTFVSSVRQELLT